MAPCLPWRTALHDHDIHAFLEMTPCGLARLGPEKATALVHLMCVCVCVCVRAKCQMPHCSALTQSLSVRLVCGCGCAHACVGEIISRRAAGFLGPKLLLHSKLRRDTSMGQGVRTHAGPLAIPRRQHGSRANSMAAWQPSKCEDLPLWRVMWPPSIVSVLQLVYLHRQPSSPLEEPHSACLPVLPPTYWLCLSRLLATCVCPGVLRLASLALRCCTSCWGHLRVSCVSPRGVVPNKLPHHRAC